MPRMDFQSMEYGSKSFGGDGINVVECERRRV